MNLFDKLSDFVESWENRKQEREIERDLEARRGKMQIQRHIKKQRDMSKKLWELGKRALALDDTRQFEQIGKQYLWTLQDVKRWERYLLTFEAIEARRDQVKSTSEFMRSVQAMSKSMLANAKPADIAKMQRDLEMGLARAQNLEQTFDYLMEMTDETVFAMDTAEDTELATSLQELGKTMNQEGESSVASEELDPRIAEGLKKIEEEMKKSK